MWDVDGYQVNCSRIQNVNQVPRTPKDGDVACTGYALLCYLGAGYDHLQGKYKKTVKDGLDWLIEAQDDNGSWGVTTNRV